MIFLIKSRSIPIFFLLQANKTMSKDDDRDDALDKAYDVLWVINNTDTD